MEANLIDLKHITAVHQAGTFDHITDRHDKKHGHDRMGG